MCGSLHYSFYIGLRHALNTKLNNIILPRQGVCWWNLVHYHGVGVAPVIFCIRQCEADQDYPGQGRGVQGLRLRHLRDGGGGEETAGPGGQHRAEGEEAQHRAGNKEAGTQSLPVELLLVTPYYTVSSSLPVELLLVTPCYTLLVLSKPTAAELSHTRWGSQY